MEIINIPQHSYPYLKLKVIYAPVTPASSLRISIYPSNVINFFVVSPIQKIGFTAVRHSNSAVHGNEIIIFGTSISNEGSAYNPTSGIFKAPVNGLYVFFYDLECMTTNGDTYVKLMKNAVNTGIESYCHGLGDIDNSSTLGVLHLEAGDMVSIRLSNSDSKFFGYKTIFSGFLI